MTEPAAPLILIVDDYHDAREMYSEYLVYRGFRVVEAVDGAQAVEQAQTQQPNLILMDLSLPGIDGWEATRMLKADPRTAGIPVVALTGHALDGAAESAAEAGCDAFVVKPCTPDDLVAKMWELLQVSRAD